MSSDFVEVKVPALGESVVEATVAKWHKKPGDPVRVDEILVELETDKVTLEVAAPISGVMESQSAPQGGTVQVGGILGLIRTADASAQSAPMPTPDLETAPAPVQEPVLVPAPIGVSTSPIPQAIKLEVHHEVPSAVSASMSLAPSVQKLVDENQLNAGDIAANGKDGRLTKADVLNHLNTASSPAPLATPPQVASFSDERLEKRVQMSRLRQRIAQRLKEAQNTAAILTTFNEVDMSMVINLRNKYKDAFEKKHGVKLGFMSFFVKACVHALQKIPQMNSRIEGDEIVTCNYFDIGVAVSAPNGLVVPVVRDADLLDYAGVERAIANYGQKAKENKLTLEEMTGGTFTISNGGTFGSLLSTPIINPPQSGILGMHKTQERPVVIDGRIEIRPMMYLAVSYDHRLIDGREAVTFLVTIKDALENPGKFLLDL
jgi:2-oxoglutarate dehydrogenase E2 component (dihydrolipoamide succinyltransferase)